MTAFRQEVRALLRLAGPLVVVSGGIQLMSLVDTAVVGRLSPVALAAAGLGNAIFFTPSVLGFGLMMGLDPLLSQAVGAHDWERGRRLLAQSVWLALGVSLLLTPPIFFLPSVLRFAGVPPEVVAPSSLFLRLRLVSLFPMLLLLGGRSYLQAHGKMRPLVVGTGVANLVNLAGDYLLVFGGAALPTWMPHAFDALRWMPALGIAGAAISTTLCATAQTLWVLGAIRRSKERLWGPPDAALLRKAVSIGLPVGLQMAAEYGVFGLSGVLVGQLGTAALAAHQVALQLASFTFMGASGLAAAASVRVGIHVGARNLDGVRRAGWIGLGIAGTWMGASAVALLIFPSPFARLLTNQAPVLAVAIPLLLVVAAFQLSDGIQAVAAGLLRGAGDTRFSFGANLAGHYLIGLPLGLWLGFHLRQGVTGLWWGLALGLTVVALALVLRFFRLASRAIVPLGDAGPEAQGIKT